MSSEEKSAAGKRHDLDGSSSKLQALNDLGKEAPGDSWGLHLLSKWAASWERPPISSNEAVLSYIGWGPQSEEPPYQRDPKKALLNMVCYKTSS